MLSVLSMGLLLRGCMFYIGREVMIVLVDYDFSMRGLIFLYTGDNLVIHLAQLLVFITSLLPRDCLHYIVSHIIYIMTCLLPLMPVHYITHRPRDSPLKGHRYHPVKS